MDPIHGPAPEASRSTPSAAGAGDEPARPLQRETEALRVQAAAVAAQQAALTETETRLVQRAVALQRQEEQLATHLEMKRRQLLERQTHLQRAREQLQQERTTFVQGQSAQMRELARERQEAAQSQQQVQEQRKRLLALRERLRQRWHRHWDAQVADLRRREEELVRNRGQLDQDTRRLQEEKAALRDARLRFNGEVELGRRQLQDGWDRLQQKQQTREEQHLRRQAELRQLARSLSQREQQLRAAEQVLAHDRRRGEARRLALAKETEGLDNRIRNQRRKLLEHHQEVIRLETVIREAQARNGPTRPEQREVISVAQAPSRDETASPSLPAVVPCKLVREDPATAEVEPRRSVEVLQHLAAVLADQRLHLVEQWEHFLRAQQRWREDHASVVAELETAGLQLREREQTLAARELALLPLEGEWRQRLDEIVRERYSLTGWQARLAARTAAWERPRERLLVHLEAREETVDKYLAILAALRQRWVLQRQQEADRLRAEQTRCQEVCQRYSTLRDEYVRRTAELERAQRTLAEQALALEQYRSECVGRSGNTPAAEKRLERLRRRWAALSAAAQRRLARQREALKAETAAVDQRMRQVQQTAASLTAREAELANRQTAWDHQQTLSAGEQARLRRELQSLRAQRDCHERELRELRDEVERMAQRLIEETETSLVPRVRAA